MANFPEKTDCCAGTCVKFGAPDLRRISRLFNNQDVSTCTYCCSTVCIHESNEWEFQSDCTGLTALYFQEPNAGVQKIRIKTTALAACAVATIPAIGSADNFTFDATTATLTKKTISLSGCNTLDDGCAITGDVMQYCCTCCNYKSRALRETIMVRFGDSTTTICTGDGQYEFQMPYNFTLTDIYATVATASSCGIPSFQVQQSSLDILSTAITIDAGEKTSRTAVTPVVISDTTLDINGVIEFDLDAVGTSVTGLVFYLIGYQRF